MPAELFRLKVDLSGSDVVTFDKRKLRRAMRAAGSEVATLARSMVRKSAGGGRSYATRRAGAIIGYQASVPGQPPFSRTGSLASSISVRQTRGGDGVSIREAEAYGKFLETGAVGGGPGRRNRVNRRGGVRAAITTSQRVLQPRPYLSAALDARRSSIEARLRAAIVDGVEFVKQKQKL